jgi:response regulator RpfG family c-di-GMP phosphodiesterase
MGGSAASTILVADDDPTLQFALIHNLRAEGYDVISVNDGQQALARARDNDPDLIVLDVTMPKMNGVDALRHLKEDPKTAEIPVIMLTARADVEHRVLGLDCGADEYVTKPFEMAELMARIRSMRRLSIARRELAVTNSRLSREVSDKTHRLDVLYWFARRLNEAHCREDVYQLVAEAVQEATGARRLSLLLPDEQGRLRCVKAVGLPSQVAKNLLIKSGEGIAGTVYETGRTLVAEDVTRCPVRAARYETDTFLSAPLLSTRLTTQEEAIGVLNVTEKPGGASFTQEETECVGSIADMAAVAIHNQMRRAKLDDAMRVLLLTIGRLSEFRDDETATHLERVQQYAGLLARQLRTMPKYEAQIDDEFVKHLELCTPLHDIGKVGIPDEILLKAGGLTPEEFEIMKRHVEIGLQTLEVAAGTTEPVPLLQMCIEIVHGHHERYDGSGYPLGRRGAAIPLPARIVALADAYDAITSRRPYKEALPHPRAVAIITAEAGRHFDPDVVDAFLARADEFDTIRCRTQSEQERQLAAVLQS